MQIAYLIAHKNFRDEEYFIPHGILLKAGIKVKTFSDKGGLAIGSQGGDVETEKIENIKMRDFTGIVLAGGSGAVKYLDNEKVYSLLNKFKENKKLIAAICISPTILSKANLLDSKKATVWTSLMDKSAVKILEENGAIYKKDSVVVDGDIITADGPDAAERFALTIAKKLN